MGQLITKARNLLLQCFLHPLKVPDTVGLCGPKRGPEFLSSGGILVRPCGPALAVLPPQR